ncbi:hypothetical protein M758_12G160600 [Ceratodon purpureus]|nr:hypothetical protein M758_12G160600 [Ceratodon purpureus]
MFWKLAMLGCDGAMFVRMLQLVVVDGYAFLAPDIPQRSNMIVGEVCCFTFVYCMILMHIWVFRNKLFRGLNPICRCWH